MDISLISVPFDLAEYNRGMGRAPAALQAAGLVARLQSRGIRVAANRQVSLNLGEGDRLARLGRLARAVADLVAEARAGGTLPVVLGGDCLTALGVCAGLQRSLGEKEFGIAWFDAHGDFNTPKTTLSGYLGGMPLACLCGRGMDELRASSGLSRPASEQHTLILGVRDLDPPEKALLDQTPVRYLSPEEIQAEGVLVEAIQRFQSLPGVYLHLDIDVLDPQEAPGVSYLTPRGLSRPAAIAAGRAIMNVSPLVALTLAAVNPEIDPHGKTVETGIWMLGEILAAGSPSGLCTHSSGPTIPGPGAPMGC